MLRVRLAERDVLEQVAESQHYQKNSLSRIVRDATAVSFSDLLTFLRVAQVEVALLESDATVSQIASEAGFSDAKYLTRAFRAWFGERPADFRRRVRPLTVCDERVTDVGVEGELLAEKMRKAPASVAALPRLSVTPLLVKSLGNRSDLFRSIESRHDLGSTPQLRPVPRVPHLLPIRVPLDGASPLGWTDLLCGIDRARFQPVLLLPWGNAEVLEGLIRQVAALDVEPPTYWITYEPGTAESAERVAVELAERCGITAIPFAAA